MHRFETITLEGVDLVLWGDLRIMFDANVDDELWQNQERWNLKSWDFYEYCGVHTLTLEDGTEIHMLVERKYPLKKETLERMMSLKLIAEFANLIEDIALERDTKSLPKIEREAIPVRYWSCGFFLLVDFFLRDTLVRAVNPLRQEMRASQSLELPDANNSLEGVESLFFWYKSSLLNETS
ncbi:hypothetical protein Tco_0158670 [Tanacetum coccineum]